jgi:hypothetical protein
MNGRERESRSIDWLLCGKDCCSKNDVGVLERNSKLADDSGMT